MPRICYTPCRFSTSVRATIHNANAIIAEYQAQGFTLTLRQLYYQFVARGFIANTVQSYKRLGSAINDARLAGEIDWNAIEDRTRNLVAPSIWESPRDIIEACASSYRRDLWANLEYRVEVWVEKEALSGVFENVCRTLRLPLFSCRGYTSQSEMWVAGQRLRHYRRHGQEPIILHFGDHDPSGIDMTRDIIDRLTLFLGDPVEIKRLALNMDQVEEHAPPPNPAKVTDSRYQEYERLHGDESWELDALEPVLLAQLVTDAVAEFRDETAWEAAVDQEEEERRLLGVVAERWDRLTRNL